MARWTRGALCLLLLLGLSGCAGGGTAMMGRRAGLVQVGQTRAAVIPPLGILYSKVRAPVMAGAPADLGTRRGEATVHQIGTPPIPGIAPAIRIAAWGDASKQEAAKNGGLQSVSHMDYELTTVLMIWRRFKLIAYGD